MNMKETYGDCADNSERFAVLLRQIHTKLLKPCGFKKNRQTFRQIRTEGVLTRGAILDFQKSAYNDRAELRFTVNLGRKTVIGSLDPRFRVYDCELVRDQERLAFLSPKYGCDKWWSVTARTNMPLLEQELLELIQKNAFPWLYIDTRQ